MNDTVPTDPTAPAASGDTPIKTATPAAPTPCANCGAPLQGPYCHDCGQPLKGLIRPLSGLTADVADSVLNIDSRILRTLGPLYFKPGFLTTEYFIGRRVRYVTPFRLFFFLTIVAFLVTQIFSEQVGLNATISSGARLGANAVATIQQATTTDDVSKERDVALAGLEAALKNTKLPAEARREIEAAREEIRKAAQLRIDALKARDEAKAAGRAPPVPALPAEAGDVALPATPPLPGVDATTPPPIPDPDATVPPPAVVGRGDRISFNGKSWDPKTDPLRLSWLPDAGNAKLNAMVSNAIKNAKSLSTEPKRVVAAFFGVLPQTLFVLMPLFAVILKLFYLFKRRYYMEHLMVALHSHAFLSLSMLVVSLLGLARLALPALAAPLGWLMLAAVLWMPLYLLIMQKRVYRQNWFMTIVKYGIVGTVYSVLIAFAVIAALAISLVVA